MNERERFLATLGPGRPDRLPVFDLEPGDSTIELWREQGLPPDSSVADYFGLETHHSIGLEIRSAPFYEGAPDLLDAPAAFDRHYDADDPDRLPPDFEARCRRFHREGRVVYVNASGGGLLQMLGVRDWDSLVNACDALVNRPSFVEALLERTTDFHCLLLDRVLSNVKVDYASLYEPIASNAGPLISPEMFERFSMPGYRRVLDLLRRHDVEHRIFCTTGGDLGPLLPMLLDAGVNGLWISNVMTEDMKYANLRREFGPDISLIGGIDSTALTRGEDDVRRAVEETVPPLLADGRY
ncbi:MAG: uroporphyrinogen decarboxylase family protein, partial [Candidatus Sulfomarinibacteraceae bacterium]